MPQSVLVIHYSQTGQLSRILDKFIIGLGADVEVDHLRIQPEEAFPFPWTRMTFFNTFPESVYGIPLPLKEVQVDLNKHYDLVVLGYTIWYLSPCIPINSFLKSEKGQALLQGKKVLTVLGARNMWIMAQEKMKVLLRNCNADLVGNIALVDRSPNLVSIITIIRWMFYNKTKPVMGLPQAGIRQSEINSAEGFGQIVAKHLGDLGPELNSDLIAAGAAEMTPSLLHLEKHATRTFRKYAQFILAKGNYHDKARRTRVASVSIFIPVAAFLFSPITKLISTISILVNKKKLKAEVQELQQCNTIHPLIGGQ